MGKFPVPSAEVFRRCTRGYHGKERGMGLAPQKICAALSDVFQSLRRIQYSKWAQKNVSMVVLHGVMAKLACR